jgi:hypothetical protein
MLQVEALVSHTPPKRLHGRIHIAGLVVNPKNVEIEPHALLPLWCDNDLKCHAAALVIIVKFNAPLHLTQNLPDMIEAKARASWCRCIAHFKDTLGVSVP